MARGITSKCAILAAAVVVSVVSLLLIVILFETFSDERRNDLKAATVADIASLGTCVSSVHEDAIAQTEALKDDWLCAGATSEKEALSNLLAANTHAFYHAAASSSDPHLLTVANVVLPTALGVTHGAVNASSAKLALEALALVSVPATCAEVYAGASEAPVPGVVLPEITCGGNPPETATNTWSESVNVLYSHCVRQFAFGESGPAPGSFGVPVVGNEAGPNFILFPLPSNLTGQTSSTKAKVYLGVRFGSAAWAYSLLMLGLGFCFIDGIMILISDGSEEDRVEGTYGAAGSNRTWIWMMMATKVAKRNRRWIILLLIIILAAIFLGLFLWGPYGMGYRLGSPVCEAAAGRRMSEDFRLVAGAKGGWKDDWGPTFVEILCLGWLIVCLVLLPLARSASGFFSPPGRLVEDSSSQTPEGTRAHVDKGSLGTGTNFAIASLGTVCLVLAFAITGMVFGYAWVKATMGKDVSWSAEATSGLVYNHSLDALFVMVACGMVLAAIQGRWTIVGYGSCQGICLPILVWILMAFLPIFLVLAVIGLEIFVDRDANTGECEIFQGGFDAASCTVKWILLIVGAILILFVLIVMAVGALLRRLSTIASERSEKVGPAPPKENPSKIRYSANLACLDDEEPLLGGGTITRGASRKLGFHLPIRVEK